jgi:hypothetical protein
MKRLMKIYAITAMLFAFMTQSFVWADVSNTEAGSLAAPLSDDSINLVPERGEILEKSSSVQHHAEQSLSREEIVSAFLQTAFSPTVWMPNEAQKKEAGFFSFLFGHSEANYWLSLIKDEVPWISPFVGRMGRDLPEVNAIHKWPGEITIGFDIPPYGAQCEKVLAEQFCLNKYTYAGSVEQMQKDGMYPIVEQQVVSLIPELKKLTNRSVRFIPNNTSQEKTSEHARIRIVWMRGNRQKNYFKSFYPICNIGCSVSSAGWFGKIHEYLWGGVPFTPESRAQVDGYILPYSNNHIGLSVCRINPYVGVEMVKALVTECLIRSLGLPGMLDDPDMVLGRWNKDHEAHSKKIGLDDDAYLSPEVRYFSPDLFPHEITKKQNLLVSLSRRDKEMVSLLYCDDIVSGMTQKQVRQIILAGKCLSKAGD